MDQISQHCFFNQTGVRLYLSDAVAMMNLLPAESADLIFADPPYGLSNGGFTCHAGRRVPSTKAL